MEDFSTRIYGTSVLDNRPLFGETSAKDRIINLVVGSLTSLLILVTLISAFVFPQLPPKPLNIFFAVCISLSSITACILSYDLREELGHPTLGSLWNKATRDALLLFPA